MRGAVVLAALSLVAARAPLAQAEQARVVAVELVVGERDAKSAVAWTSLQAALERRGITAGAVEVTRALARAGSTPARTVPPLGDDYPDKVEQGYKQYIRGKFDQAIAQLVPLIEAGQRNPAVLAQNQRLRDGLQRALIGVALAEQRRGNLDESRRAMAELLRSFPDAALTRAAHGPEAFELFEATRKDLARGGRGVLEVAASDPSTTVFVNERFERVGSFSRPDLAPGRYRLYAVLGQRESRAVAADVPANGKVRVEIDWEFDRALHQSSWVGFLFDDEAQARARAGGYTRRLARLVDAHAVVTAELQSRGKKRLWVISRIDGATGRATHRASLDITETPTSSAIDALASLAADTPVPPDSGIVVELAPVRPAGKPPGKPTDTPRDQPTDLPVEPGTSDAGEPSTTAQADPPPRADRPSSSRYGALKFVAAGAGVAAIGAGAYLFAIHGNCSQMVGTTCMNEYDNIIPGSIAMGAGVALGALSVYLFATDRVTVTPAPGGAVAAVTWRY